MASDKAARSECDKERVEIDYRAGLLSIREIGRIHNLSDKTIRNWAKEYEWERDLTAKVNEKVRTELVRSESAHADLKTEQAIINEAAATQVQVVRSHRKAIQRGNSLVEKLTEQLFEAINGRAGLEDDIDAETADDKSPERKNRMKKAVSLEKHAQIANSLAQATKIWVGLERQAFNIADVAGPNNTYDMPDDQRRARIAELEAKINGAK